MPLRNTSSERTKIRTFYCDLPRNEQGAIDLASIMVGILVIGLIGGVIAATVFAVIPWTQDKAAKQQLDSIAAAQSAYRGLSSSGALPESHSPNSFGNSAELAQANLMPQGEKYCTVKTADGQGYTALVQSASKRVFQISDKNTSPTRVEGVETLPTDCASAATPPTPTTPTTPPVDTSRQTSLTYKCDADTTGSLPVRVNLKGIEKWSDGLTNEYNGAAKTTPRTLKAGVEYKVTFEGTYEQLSTFEFGTDPFMPQCITSLDTWGKDTGVTSAPFGLANTKKLTSVPSNIPPTLTTMSLMFGGSAINDPNISSWDVSNVTVMYGMFSVTPNFNQPLNNWNVSKVTSMSTMFNESGYNQPLDKWNVSNVTDMSYMFTGSAFNQPISNWDVSKVTNMSYMFIRSTFSQNLSGWKTTSLVAGQGAEFASASFNSAYLPPKTSKAAK